jgi:hypothetical protein
MAISGLVLNVTSAGTPASMPPPRSSAGSDDAGDDVAEIG